MSSRTKSVQQAGVIFAVLLVGFFSSLLNSDGWSALSLFISTFLFGFFPFFIVCTILIFQNKEISSSIFKKILIFCCVYFLLSFFQVGDGGVGDKGTLIFLHKWYPVYHESYDTIETLRTVFSLLSVGTLVLIWCLIIYSLIHRNK